MEDIAATIFFVWFCFGVGARGSQRTDDRNCLQIAKMTATAQDVSTVKGWILSSLKKPPRWGENGSGDYLLRDVL